MTPSERMRLSRQRRRRGEVPKIDVLVARGYDLDRTDDESIARAVKMLLADTVLRQRQGRAQTTTAQRYGSSYISGDLVKPKPARASVPNTADSPKPFEDGHLKESMRTAGR
jgi:hypothetical protein